MTIKELQAEAYAIALSQGLYAEKCDVNSCLSAIIAEVYEMVAAHRKRRYADMASFKKVTTRNWFKWKFKTAYNVYIKDTLQDEFADVAILIMSFAEHKGIELSGKLSEPWYRNFSNYSMNANAFAFAKNATRTHKKGGKEISLQERLTFLRCFIFEWARQSGVDMPTHIILKMKYNENRSYKHMK